MPLLDPSQLRGTAFLYPSKDAAENHAKVGGTGFFVGRPVRDFMSSKGGAQYVPYLVSNTHVVSNGQCSVARFNRADDSPCILDFHPSDWISHPDADVAAVCIYGVGTWTRNDLTFVGTDNFVTQDKLKEWKVGIGDEVFMVGRFLNHQGANLIRPAARFGSISMMQEPIWNKALGHEEESYAVEMRSRTGFSGSPVTVYRSGATNIAMFHPIPWFHGLLGVNWGYIYDKETGENSWLNGVVPAWKIIEVLESSFLEKKHKEAEVRIKEGSRAVGDVF